MIKLTKFILFAAFCILAGCISVEGLYQDSSFTYASVQNGNIGVGGVASTVKELSPEEQSSYSALLQNALIKHFPGMDIMPQGDAVRALGYPRYSAMMKDYAKNGVISDQYLIAFKKHISRMQYLVFGRILSDQVTQYKSEQNHYDDEKETHVVSRDEMYNTSLEIRIAIVVYDLQKQRLVWSGNVVDQQINTNTYNESVHHNFWHEALSEMTYDVLLPKNPYPQAPAADSLIGSIFSDLMTKFPVMLKTR